jgi:hypothetical protein
MQPGSRSQWRNSRKSDRPLLPGQEKITKNVRPRSRPPSKALDKRLEWGLFPIPRADLPVFLVEGKTFQRKEWTDQIFANALGLFFGLGSDLTVD